MKKTKVKKFSIILITMILLLVLSGIIYADSLPKTEIVCEDINLYKKLVSELGYVTGGGYIISADQDTKTIQIFESSVSSITELDLSSSSITNLTGLENFTSLQNLNLLGNSITSIEPITGLTSIKILNLSGNQVKITDVDKLSNLTNMVNLNMSSSQITNVDFMSDFNSLQTLDVSGNGISSLAPISGLLSLTNLNIAKNTSFSRMEDILSFSNIKQLDISETGLLTLDKIYTLQKLKVLKVQRLEIDLSPIIATYKNEENETLSYLSALEELDISYTTKSISFGNLAYLENLKRLYMIDVVGHWKGTTSTSLSLSNIYKLPKIEYINLSNNNISSLTGILYTKTVNGATVLVDYLKATEIILQNNNIGDLTLLSSLPQAIKVLDLSYNKISSTDPLNKCNFTADRIINLRFQDITWNVYKKTSVDQYIILPDIFQDSKKSGSLVYADNSDFSINYTNVVTQDIIKLNTEEVYLQPDNYNVIISKDVAVSKSTDTDEQKLKLKLTGTGIAAGSTVTFNIGTTTSYIDSVLFKDANLCEAIKENLVKKGIYARNAHFILNLSHTEITSIKELDLSSRDIHDLSGMESFVALTTLNLSGNAVTTIDQLQYCTNMLYLNVSNNKIVNNNTAIEKMIKLTDLYLSNTGMTNINSIETLIDYWTSKKKFTLTTLDISGNGFTNNDINRIAEINSLTQLNVSNNKLDTIETFEPLKSKVSVFNISQNQIQDISVLSKFTNLTSLDLSNNKIEDISPVSVIGTITSLKFSGNKVKDISSLSNLVTSLITLNMDDNKIEDVSAVDVDSSLIKQELSAGTQKIIKTLSKDDTGTITVELPQIFKASQNSSSRFYTSSAMNISPTDSVTLFSDGASIIIDLDALAGGIAVAKITGGEAKGTTLAVATPIEAVITYSVEDMTKKTNQDIVATINFANNNRDVTITNNEGKNTYTFDKNGEFTFEYTDEYGFEGTATAVVDNIDKDPPVATVKKEIKNKQVIVTITVNEKVADIDGWTSIELVDGKMALTKTYSVDADDNLNLVDEAGNTTSVNVQVKIDKTNPVITGVENGKTYNGTVTPVIQDESEYTVTLTKDGVIVANYKSGDAIKEAGQYVITVTDVFDNTTTVSFEIIISDIITSKDDNTVTVIEDETTVKDISPKTTVSALKQKLNAEMEYTIVDKNGTEISETANVGTGCKIKMENGKMYTLIVKGDCNGDGQAELKDILAINKHRLNKSNLTAEYLQAADVDGNGKAELKDILQINKFRLGKTNEL